MIVVEKIWKSFRRTPVLKDINLVLNEGLTHVIIGPSGCGKSTLLRLLAGLIKPDSGKVLLGEREAALVPDREKAGLFGYLIQDGGLFPHLTNWQNILLAAKTKGKTTDETTNWARELGQMVELDETLLARYPRQISGGQRQRVALIRALLLNPPLLFLDEPMGALDPLVRSSLQTSLRDIFGRLKKTVVLVTHDLAEAAYFADTVTLMKDGLVEQHGTFEELAKSPSTAFVTEYLSAQRPPPRLRDLL